MRKNIEREETDLRIPSVRRGKQITITVDGKSIAAYEGEILHGTLTAAGIQILGSTMKRHQPRGVLCGMGICYQCLVRINGIPDQRACMTPVEDGMVIETDQKTPLMQRDHRMPLETISPPDNNRENSAHQEEDRDFRSALEEKR